jgi:prephenate dehydrogenase
LTMARNKIAIIGLGLIGGSLARALHEKLGFCGITAVDTNKRALDMALDQGIIEKGITEPDSSVYSSDIIFICTPVNQTLEYIAELAPRIKETCIITDVGSTKEEIIRQVKSMQRPPCFIGGHPMAGAERSGFENSYAHLFENAYYVLTPSASTTPESLEALSDIIAGIGAIPIVMSAEEHDMAAAGISHLPHVIAAALVNLVRELDQGTGRMQALAAGGFRDITRIASSNPVIWESIVLSNKKHLIRLVEQFRKSLESFSENLKNGDSEEIYNFFAGAGRFRDAISEQTQGLIQPLYKLTVDVKDRPGIIGEITTMLGRNNINIKNINVANSREFEQGCLIITFSDKSNANIAFDLLMNAGYKVYKGK